MPCPAAGSSAPYAAGWQRCRVPWFISLVTGDEAHHHGNCSPLPPAPNPGWTVGFCGNPLVEIKELAVRFQPLFLREHVSYWPDAVKGGITLPRAETGRTCYASSLTSGTAVFHTCPQLQASSRLTPQTKLQMSCASETDYRSVSTNHI